MSCLFKTPGPSALYPAPFRPCSVSTGVPGLLEASTSPGMIFFTVEFSTCPPLWCGQQWYTHVHWMDKRLLYASICTPYYLCLTAICLPCRWKVWSPHWSEVSKDLKTGRMSLLLQNYSPTSDGGSLNSQGDVDKHGLKITWKGRWGKHGLVQ